jgi:osmotically-inducible protein OsmY
VSLTGADRRDDDKVRGAALQNLIWDVDVPSDLVDVKVDDGWVTLKGDVSYQLESDAAYDEVASLYGVLGVTNEIVVSSACPVAYCLGPHTSACLTCAALRQQEWR